MNTEHTSAEILPVTTGKPETKKTKKTLNPWTQPTFTHRRALMVGDAVIEEAAPDTVAKGGTTALIKGLPLTEHLRKNRGVKSFGEATENEKEADKNELYNLVEGSIIQTRPQTPGVRVAFEMAVLPADFAPAQNGNEAYMTAVPVLKALFAQHDPLSPFEAPVDNVALRLALATVNASWLWRNRTLASTIKVRVSWRVFEKDGTFQSHELLVDNVRHWPFDPAKILPGGSLADPHGWVAIVATLAKDMARTFRDDTLVMRCFVEAWLDVPASTRVFPSQLRTETGDRSYFQLPGGEGHFGLTAEKISNKLRTLDAWHGDDRFKDTSIPIEIFGSSLEYGFHVREDTPKAPFRSLLKLWTKLVNQAHFKSEKAVMNTLTALTSEEQHFIAAWFLRGGTGTYNTKIKNKNTTEAPAAGEAAAANAAPELTA